MGDACAPILSYYFPLGAHLDFTIMQGVASFAFTLVKGVTQRIEIAAKVGEREESLFIHNSGILGYSHS